MPKELQARLDYIQRKFKDEGLTVTVVYSEDDELFTATDGEQEFLANYNPGDDILVFTDEDADTVLECPVPDDWQDQSDDDEDIFE